jgi:hypothetical protein
MILRFILGRSVSLFCLYLTVYQASTLSQDVTRHAQISDLTQLSPTFDLSQDAGVNPYYRLTAKVVVHAHCIVPQQQGRAFYLSMRWQNLTSDCRDPTFCRDLEAQHAMMEAYPLGVVQTASGEVLRVHYAQVRATSEQEAQLLTQVQRLQRAFVQQWNTFVPPNAFDRTGSLSLYSGLFHFCFTSFAPLGRGALAARYLGFDDHQSLFLRICAG